MHQVRPPEVGVGHLQLAAAPCPLGHDFAFLVQKKHFQLEVFIALDKNLVIHQPCKRQERSDKKGRDTARVIRRGAPCGHHSGSVCSEGRLSEGSTVRTDIGSRES